MIYTRSQSSSSVSDQLLPYLPIDAKVIATASARIYYASFGGRPESWQFSGLSGILVFGRDRVTLHPDRNLSNSYEQNFWFRLIDVTSEKGLVWMHSIGEGFDYRTDKPFFHIFPGKTRMFGFRFDEDAEAARIFKKVNSRVRATLTPPRKTKKLSTPSIPLKRLASALISSPSPNTFVHLAHVGLNERAGAETSDDMDSGWSLMLEEVQSRGVTESMAHHDRKFVDGFLANVKASSPKETAVTLVGENIPPSPRRKIRRKPVTIDCNAV